MTVASASDLLTRADVVAAIRGLGLSAGDTVMIHSDLRRFGMIRDDEGRLGLALAPPTLYAALRDVVGPSGTVVVPTFSYSWTRGLPFSLERSPSLEGSFSEYVRSLPGTLRSRHPLMSVAAVGPAAEDLLAGVDETSFGADSSFGRLHRADTKQVTVGVAVCSFADYVQWAGRVPYRYAKRFRGWIEIGGRLQEAECEHCVRYIDQGLEPRPVFEVLDGDHRGCIRETRLAGIPLRLVSSGDLFDLMRERLDADPYAFSTRPSDERALGRLAGLLLPGRSPGLRVLALNQGGIERWAWIVPARLLRVLVSIQDSDDRTVATSEQGAMDVLLDAACGLGVDDRLSGAELIGHVATDRGELTSERLARMGWLICPNGGAALRLFPEAMYHVCIEVEAGQAEDPGAGACDVVVMPRTGRSGAAMAIEFAIRRLEAGGPGHRGSALSALIWYLLDHAPVVATLGEGGSPAVTGIPVLAPDLARGVEAARPVEPARVG